MAMNPNGTDVHGLQGEQQGLPYAFGMAVYEYLSSSLYVRWAVVVVAWLSTVSMLQTKRPRIPNAQVHGSKGWWEPSFLLKLRFIYDAQNIINSGYKKVCLLVGHALSAVGDRANIVCNKSVQECPVRGASP